MNILTAAASPKENRFISGPPPSVMPKTIAGFEALRQRKKPAAAGFLFIRLQSLKAVLFNDSSR
jgi:hypothetical protein